MRDNFFFFLFLFLFLEGCISKESIGLAPIDQWIAPDYESPQNDWLLDYAFFNFYADSLNESCLLDSFETKESFDLKCKIRQESIEIGAFGSLTWKYTDPCWTIDFHGGLTSFDGETALICPLDSLL